MLRKRSKPMVCLFPLVVVSLVFMAFLVVAEDTDRTAKVNRPGFSGGFIV
jgi:hypothetical protein